MIQRYFFRGYDIHPHLYIKLKKIPSSTVKMTLALEDPNFYKHLGFEPEMIKQAWKRNQKAGRIRFGASTISNQVARTVFLTTDRNYFRKYLEIQTTIIMELLMTKNRMLELYFNYVEWGKGIYGIESASQYYYRKSTPHLTRMQAKKLVSILTNPIKYTPETYFRSASARQRFQMLQRYM